MKKISLVLVSIVAINDGVVSPKAAAAGVEGGGGGQARSFGRGCGHVGRQRDKDRLAGYARGPRASAHIGHGAVGSMRKRQAQHVLQ